MDPGGGVEVWPTRHGSWRRFEEKRVESEFDVWQKKSYFFLKIFKIDQINKVNITKKELNEDNFKPQE